MGGDDLVVIESRLPRPEALIRWLADVDHEQGAVASVGEELLAHAVGIEAAHVRWHSQQGPNDIANALALCALHHALFDLGVLGITEDCQIRVSSLYVARNEAGMAVDALAGKPLLIPRPQQPKVDVIHISWHDNQVFKGTMRRPTQHPRLGR